MKSIRHLQKIAKGAVSLDYQSKQNPISFWSPTPVQLRVLQDQSKIVLLRGGNQIGKTQCGCVETICRVLGYSKFKKVPLAPIEAWIVVHSWEQSKTIMGKFHDMVPKHELHPDVEYIAGRGYRGTGAPVIRFRNGSIIRFKTTNQGTLGLSAGTIDFVWIDEPAPPHLFGEIKSRITRTRGSILLTMTPIGAPVDYLKQLVKDKIISEHVGVMNVENTTPINCRPLMTEAEVEQLRLSFLPLDRDARMNGSWEAGIPEGRIFDHFTEDLISDLKPNPNRDYVWSIGIDHGHDIASQVAILCAIDITDRETPIVYVVDEYVASGSSAEIHAKMIIAMIKRNGLDIAMIQRWTGDRSHGGSRSHGGRMSNTMLTAAFCHVLNYPKGKLPFRIRTAYKPNYSVYYGCQMLHETMCAGRFQIFPRCKRTIKSLKFWALKKSGSFDTMSEYKHCIDALRYGTIGIINTQYRAPKQSKMRFR